MNKSNGILLSSLVLLGMLLITVNASAATRHVGFPISGTVFNPCNGETVTFSGVFNAVFAVTLDGNGGFHSMYNDQIHVTATGSLGNSYEGNEEDHSPLTGRVGVEQTFSSTFSEISKGSAPNFEQHSLFHITVNPDGTVTAFVTNFTSACR